MSIGPPPSSTESTAADGGRTRSGSSIGVTRLGGPGPPGPSLPSASSCCPYCDARRRSCPHQPAGCRRPRGPSSWASVFLCLQRSCSWLTATVDILPGQQLTASDFIGGPPVLVAKKFIPTGTAGSMAAKNVISVPTLSPKEVEDGAITDPWYLAGRAATVDIFPGQQLTVSDFTTGERDMVFVAKQLIKKGTPGSIV